MQIRVGFEITHEFPQPTPILACLSIHYSRAPDLVRPDYLIASPSVPVTQYRDTFGNWCSRVLAPAGYFTFTADAVINDSGERDGEALDAKQTPVAELPDSALLFLLGSRYCETDQLSAIAWDRFGAIEPGWGRVQAICDFVHRHIEFGYQHARRTRTAWEAYNEGHGVCRDYTHLAVALCRCMNIPARYCTGYIPDIGVEASPLPMDFAAWFEAYLDGRWYVFDPRNNQRRIGRILMAYGRDACDVALTNTFGTNWLTTFKVWADEVVPA